MKVDTNKKYYHSCENVNKFQEERVEQEERELTQMLNRVENSRLPSIRNYWKLSSECSTEAYVEV